jgi:hypothetical protein
MTAIARLLQVALPACFATLCASAPCLADGLPPPLFSTCDPIIVGNSSGTAIGGAPAGFDVSMRDANNVAMPGVVVTLDFSATGMKLYAVQDAGTTVDCAARTVSRTTDALGRVNFALRVGGFANARLVRVSGGAGLLDVNVPARSTDIDGADGRTGLGDFAYFATRYGLVTAPECNFNLSADDIPVLGDFAVFAAEYQGTSGAAYCP